MEGWDLEIEGAWVDGSFDRWKIASLTKQCSQEAAFLPRRIKDPSHQPPILKQWQKDPKDSYFWKISSCRNSHAVIRGQAVIKKRTILTFHLSKPRKKEPQ